MANTHESITRFLGRFSEELAQALGAREPKAPEVTWQSVASGPIAEELQWWKGTASSELGSAYFGGDPNTWAAFKASDESGNLGEASLPWLERSLRTALEEQLGPLAIESNSRPSEGPSEVWTRIALNIQGNGQQGEGQAHSLLCILNPVLETALRKQKSAAGESGRAGSTNGVSSNSAALKSNGILMHVEVPVSISFGRTRIAMRELLSLNSGSIVELDQALGDWVELRVNNHVIALGEVVAVDGNYGVRIMELVSEQQVPVGNERTK